MKLDDLRDFLKEHEARDKAIKTLFDRAIDLAAKATQLSIDLGKLIGDEQAAMRTTLLAKPRKTRGAVAVTPESIKAVRYAIEALDHKPTHGFKPKQLCGATGLSSVRIAAALRQLGYTEKGGRFLPLAPAEGENHA